MHFEILNDSDQKMFAYVIRHTQGNIFDVDVLQILPHN
jgi:hypothetical protein